MIEIEQKEKSKKPVNTKVIIIIVVVFAFILIAIISSLISNNDKNKQPGPNNDTPSITEIAVGQTFNLEGLNFTIKNYEFRYYAHQGSFPAGTGKVWLMVNATIANPSVERKKYDTVMNSLFYITSIGEAEYNNKYYDYKEWLLASNYLDPWESIEGYYMFNLPENIAPSPDGQSYELGGKSSSTKGLNFELRFQQNKNNPENIIKIKL